MKEFEKREIKNGVSLVAVPASRFKTNEVSVSFATKLSEKTASVNSLLINLLASCSEAYPDMLSLNRKLEMLYGAGIVSTVTKEGDCQLLTVYISSLDDRFALDNESISLECLKLLTELIFRPHFGADGNFTDGDIEREKRILCEKIEREKNEKRLYALRRLEEEMFSGEAYSANALGKTELVKAVTKEQLKTAYNDLLKSSRIQVTSVGAADIDEIAGIIQTAFDKVERQYAEIKKVKLTPYADRVKTVEERQEIKQGKLVLGFRVNMECDDENKDAMRMFSDIFGGGPYSKLFMNVREKLSLCYYCSARYYKNNNCIIIQCGCEEENMDKAVDEILNQLEEIKNGSFEYEFKSSLSGMCDSFVSVYDDSTLLLSWYLRQIFDNETVAPDSAVEAFRNIKFDDVKKCASLLSLDTVYKLMAKEEK